tara:strand:- start:542 stop:1003 length:462 start_codon:yes stop_codon:yes gene_type:complete
MNSKLWGTITWIFFHTLAEKIKEEEFEKNRIIFINIIINTCNHLPCPDCSQHATYVLKNAYLKNIKTKNHFIEFLRQFHNIINIKINNPELTREDTIDLYKKNNLFAIFKNMVNIYRSTKSSNALIGYNFHRDRYLSELSNQLKNISHLLDLH